MGRDIAVFVGDNGETTAMNLPGSVVVYKKKQGQWQEMKSTDISLEQAQGLRELRAGIAKTVEFLDDCKIFVGRSITGLPYFELEKAGCSVWEFAGKPLEFLDYVLEKEEAAEQAIDLEPIGMPVPEDLGNGCYRISIKEIQESDTVITSKQALQPILRQGNFYQLEVRCNHIPPWLEAEMMSGNLDCVSEKISDNEIKVTIRKKTNS